MNKKLCKVPFGDFYILQDEAGQGITDATTFLQETVVNNTDSEARKVLELGSGNGIISFMLALQRPTWQITGIEIQADLVTLAEHNNKELELNCHFIEGDLRQFKTLLQREYYDLIVSNPPWVKSGSGLTSPYPSRALSRQEITCTMKDILDCVKWSLKKSGIAWLIYPKERQQELTREILTHSMEIKRWVSKVEYEDYLIVKLGFPQRNGHWYNKC